MAKEKKVWRCSECGRTSPKWSGQCASCSAWNTLTEEILESKSPMQKSRGSVRKAFNLKDEKSGEKKRLKTGIAEFDRVVGGGILSDSISLLVGNPGIGKSTLVLQIALAFAEQGKQVLIASGEESVSQISDRARRLSKKADNVHILNEYYIEDILATVEDIQPDFLVLDSVQTLSSRDNMSNSGSVPQIRTVSEKAMHFVKSKNIPCILIGHVTKDGEMAGPQFLAHLVDGVFSIEGDSHHDFRMLRSSKNRFGSVNEVGVFEMTENGLVGIKNPSEAFLEGRRKDALGSIIFPTLEGSRSFLVEVQALTNSTRFGLPKRTASGISLSRLSLILAVLENHSKIKTSSYDVFTNVIGGFLVKEPALDLALALAIASARSKKPISSEIFACGELGLSGEVRAISHLERRLNEGKKLGCQKAIVPFVRNMPKVSGLEIVPVRTISEAIDLCLR